ncbi:MAG: hypothetical protein ACI39E_01675 [Acutalibacteraceae bacterium]
MKKAQKTAFCGVLCALSVMSLLMTFFPYATYALAVLGGVMLMPAAIELGTRYGLACYAVSAALSFFLAPDMEAKLLFVLFFGYYPTLQLRLVLWRNRAAAWVVRLLLFNAAMIAGYLLLLFVFGLEEDAFTIGGVSLPWVLLLLGNSVFAIYDVALTRLASLYRVRLHPLVRRLFR